MGRQSRFLADEKIGAVSSQLAIYHDNGVNSATYSGFCGDTESNINASFSICAKACT